MKFCAAFFLAACLAFAAESRMFRRDIPDACKQKCEGVPLDIAFVIDASRSISRSDFKEGLWFVQNFVDTFDIGADKVRVSAVTFGEHVYPHTAFDFDAYTDKSRLNDAIDSIPHSEGAATATGEGIAYMLDHQIPKARPGVRTIAIVLTDGNSQEGDLTKAEAERAHDSGLEVFAIGVGHDISQQELHNIASDGRHVFIVNSYDLLNNILERLQYEACGVTPHPPCQSDPVDMAFVIDSSQSIGDSNFTLGKAFIKDFLRDFEINPSAVRVAEIMFGDRVYTESEIPFDMYDDRTSLVDAIMNLQWMHGTSTETALGIDYMVDHFLPNTRAHAAHVCFVITDGKSQLWQNTINSAQSARDAGMTMFAVGVGKLGKDLDEDELNAIAGDPSRVVTADNYAKLNTIKEKLLRITCSGINESLQMKAAPYRS